MEVPTFFSEVHHNSVVRVSVQNSISSSNNNLILRYNGEITGSKHYLLVVRLLDGR